MHPLNSMLKMLKHQINFTSIIPLNFACILAYHLLLALFWLWLVACSCEWSRTKDELSAGESNYGVGRAPDATGEKRENFKGQISN